ncbi:MAG: YifB family Mg chelatase-like AAA ATPase [Alphaproteobacteria bacterium]|nr:YifB family Mg chelatase-like AAA ATPase [Alphaproteobacteria bacterium]MBN2674915.1 YifB family Mg chelatase-like AAA ATPase [Alphaproteobacteria bacterium]
MISLNSIIFNGMDATKIDVQIQMSSGLSKPEFNIIGLADRAVKESAERIRNVLSALNLSLPPKRLTVNLSPADVEKSGSHFDLPILCGILCSLNILPESELSKYIILGEIGLNGSIAKTTGVLPASVWANNNNLGIICPSIQGPEARWAGHTNIIAANHVLEIINHFKGTQILPVPQIINPTGNSQNVGDLAEVKGQTAAKRALEIAAAGGHAMLMIGPPGSGKTMIASRLPGIMPEMTADEILESSIIYSIAGQLNSQSLVFTRPFRSVHHTASAVALSGGGSDARPGEISLAHNGVLFLDELPEFSRTTLEILRQPMEGGKIMISRAKRNATYPARFQLIAAMNPCPCGHLGNPENACSRAPRCAEAYQNKISGPLLDRIDLHVDVDAVNPWEMNDDKAQGESSAIIRKRVIAARIKQLNRQGKVNAHLDGKDLENIVVLNNELIQFLNAAAEKMGMSARGYNRIKRLARTIADLRNSDNIEMEDLAEALSYRPINRGKYGI